MPLFCSVMYSQFDVRIAWQVKVRRKSHNDRVRGRVQRYVHIHTSIVVSFEGVNACVEAVLLAALSRPFVFKPLLASLSFLYVSLSNSR